MCSGVDAKGNKWETEMHNTYGYIRGTEGVDGDHIDVFLADDIDSWNGRKVYVIDQYNEDGSFDEHKVMLGFNSPEEAHVAYLSNYEAGWSDKRKIVGTPADLEDFEKWIDSSHRKTKAFAEYSSVKKANEESGAANEAPDILFREDEHDDEASFAQRHNVNEGDVRKYVQSMKTGNLSGASYAFRAIKRSVFLQNPGLSLGQFVKVFSPIKQELYERFGDIDALRDEYVQQEMEARNVMEAARKRAEEEAEAERKRQEEFELMSDKELDAVYFQALEANDEARMRDIVNEVARRRGYTSDDEFKMAHRAPSYDEEGYDKSMVDVAANKDNIRESLNEQLRMNRDEYRDESASAINAALDAIDKGEKPTVTIYRAVPKSLKEGRVRNGDWVSLSESYVKVHGEHALNGDYRIMKEEVPAENLYWDGNDINEWGYDDRSDYRYRNTRNNRKLNDLITRDDEGNVIPPSKRFNYRKDDVRYRFIGEQGSANLDRSEEATMRLDNLAVAREMEKDFNAKKDATPHQNAEENARKIKMATTLNDKSDVERNGEGAYSDDELSYENDPISKLTGKSSRSKAQRKAFAQRERQRMVERVNELAENLGLDNVEVVTDASTLDGKKQRAKGFYSKNTGKITIVIPNHANVSDVEQTLLHEAVAHYGLRQLFGEHFDTFLDNVLNNADESIRREIVEMARKHGWDFRTATEEYLAGLAENTDFERTDAGWWNKIKGLFLDMLHKIGFKGFSGVTLTDNELRYILWRSYENLAEPGRYRSILGEAEDVAKQQELKVGNYADNVAVTDDVVAEAGMLEEANERFNEALSGLTPETADKVTLWLGSPSAVLRTAGVEDRPMKLYGNKVIKKMKKHGFELGELRDLPHAVANPIAVFNNLGREGNRSILTELKTEQGNFLVTIDLGKGEIDADFNIVSSVFGKNDAKIAGWINKGSM